MKSGMGVIEVRPEGYLDGPGSDITLNSIQRYLQLRNCGYSSERKGGASALPQSILTLKKRENGNERPNS